MTTHSITLYYKQGSSDKVYQASIVPKDGGYEVIFAYGRRGTTLQTGSKTAMPVTFDAAAVIFSKLVAEKKAKGYTEGESGTPYQHTANEDRVTGIQCQLLNPIDESEVDKFIHDDNWCAQEKFDGKRILLQKEGGAIHGINRKGLRVGVPSTLVIAAQAFTSSLVIDGECVGDQLHAFDLLFWDGEDLRVKPYHQRLTALMNVLASGQQRHIAFAHIAWKQQEKADLLKQLKQHNKEGIVFKRIDAPYAAGRPNSGGAQLKHKFYATVSAVVGKINRQRSIEIRLFSNNGLVNAGNVTVPANHTVPKVGQVVDVRYLYAFKESGCLYQPVYLGLRTDVLATECTTAQLKLKNGDEEG